MKIQNDNCITNILKTIAVLQESVDKIDNLENDPSIEVVDKHICFNTRPITLFLCNNNPVTIYYRNEHNVLSSAKVFRVESVCNDTVTVTLLAPNTDCKDRHMEYVSTHETATINLSCICAVQCLPDIMVRLG